MVDLLTSIEALQQGRVSDPSQDKLLANYPSYMPTTDRNVQGDVQAVPFGSLVDPVSQTAFLASPMILKSIQSLVDQGITAPSLFRNPILSSERGSTGRQVFNSDEVIKANSSARSSGAIGSKAITPKYVAETAQPNETVLNFGAGKVNPKTGRYDHSDVVRAIGAKVDEYDFGNNVVGQLGKQYDTVFASNVLNVQQSDAMLRRTLEQIKESVKDGGRVVFNYPESPRYSGLKPEEVQHIIESVFGKKVVKVGGTNKSPLWEVR